MTTREEVKALWKRCFHDSDEFTDLYFNLRYRDDINSAIREDGKIISALQMIPYPMTLFGEVIPTSYISGACTHPDYREHGAMRRLLKETHRRMYDDGILLASLIPAEEWLFGYYARSGYAPVFGYAAEQVQVDGLCPSAGCRVEACTAPTAGHYRYFDARMRGRSSCIQHTEEDFRVIVADLLLSEGRLLVARKEGAIAGMAFAVPEGGALCFKELLADSDEVRRALLAEGASIYKVREATCLVPSSSASLRLGMARIVHAEALLRLFARAYPDAERYICLEGDEAIPENNGYYVVKQGECLRAHWAGCDYVFHSPSSLSCLLLGAEHPYMSLMLN